MTSTSDKPLAVRAAQALFLLIGLVWILLGVVTLIRQTGGAVAAVIIALLMVANAAVMLWLAWGIGQQSRRFYLLALAVLAVNIVLSITDQVGIWDLISLGVTLALFVLLLATRSHYLGGREQKAP